MNKHKRWMCVLCGFIYDEAVGLPEEGIVAGTAWEDIPEDFECPDCGFGKADFEMIEVLAPNAVSVTGPVVIVGGGIAAFSIAESIRTADEGVEITIISERNGDQYFKPTLSTAYSAKKKREDIITGTAKDFASKHNLKIVTNTRVVAIDRNKKMVKASSGASYSYEKLILATGASARKLSCQGDGQHRIMYLNEIADYDVMRKSVDAAQSVAIIGGGLVGCELADDFAAAGKCVTLFEMQQSPASSVFPIEVGNDLTSAFSDAGIIWRGGVQVREISEAEGDLCITLNDGSRNYFNCVIASVGIIPNTELAVSSGLSTTHFGAVCVDDNWRTDDQNIYALGDCACKVGHYQPFVEAIAGATAVITANIFDMPSPSKSDFSSIVLKTKSLPLFKVGLGSMSKGVETTIGNAETVYLLRDTQQWPEAMVVAGRSLSASDAKQRLRQEQNVWKLRVDQAG